MRIFEDNVERFMAFWEAQNYERMAQGVPELRCVDASTAFDRFLWSEHVAAFDAAYTAPSNLTAAQMAAGHGEVI